jgi:hypothetical protein
MGLAISLVLIEANRATRSIAGAPARVLRAMLVVATALALIGTWAEGALTDALGVPLDQRSWAVIANAIELGGRGAIVLAIGALATPLLPEGARAVLGRLGRGSLVAYVFHVPFCYGLLARPIAGRLDMVGATVFVIALEVLSFGAVVARDWVLDALARRRAEA